MREYEVTLDHLARAVRDGVLTIDEGVDAAYYLGRTGLPEEYYDRLGVTA